MTCFLCTYMKNNKTIRKFKTEKKDKSGLNEQLRTLKIETGFILDNRFEIIDNISENNFSATYKAIDKNFNTNKLIKIFGKYTEIFNDLDGIRQEAKILSDLKCDSIPVFNDLHENEFVYFDLDFIEGNSLRDLIYRGLNKKKSLSIAKQLAEILYFIHIKGFEHKDLKPENVLVDSDNKVFIIDFGTAVSNSKDKNLIYEGTPQYMPPESESKEYKFPQRDIFSFGLIVYEMLYRKYPFNLDENNNPDYKMPLNIVKSNKKLDKVIKKCISYFPEDRYSDFQQIIDDLNISTENENALYKVVTKFITQKIPFKSISDDFKKDLKYLWLSLLALLLILPFFLYLKKYDNNIEREVYIDAPPYSIFVNNQYAGVAPKRINLKKDDQVTFINDADIKIYEMFYNNQKQLRLDVKNNRVFLNKKLRGMHYYKKERINRNIDFLGIRTDIRPEKLNRLRNRNLSISFTGNVPDSLVKYIPKKTKALSLRNNQNKIDLAFLRNFKRLKALDLSGTNPETYMSLDERTGIKNLNIEKSDIKRLKRLKTLKHINLRENNVEDLSPLSESQDLVSVDISSNNINNFNPLLQLPNIRQISNLYNHTEHSDLEELQRIINDNNLKNLKTQQIVLHKKNRFKFIINFLVTLLMAVIIIQIFRMLAKKTLKSVEPTVENDKEEEDFDTKPPAPKKLDSNRKMLVQTAINDKRLYIPEKENALYYLSELAIEYNEDKFLEDKKKEVLGILDTKIKTHLSRKEYEPVYLITREINKYYPSKNNNKLFNKAKSMIEKKVDLDWAFVKGGTYFMGDFTEAGSNNALPLHEVKLDSFKISCTTITNEMYCEFLNKEGNQIEKGQAWIKTDSQYSRIYSNNGTYYVKDPYKSFPVYEVSWYGAQRYCEWAGGRLPTEAEWEYAARNRGDKTPFDFGKNISKKKANYLIDQNDTLWHSVFPVMSFQANNLEVYDMCGNILEWCYDWYDKEYYSYSSSLNPKGPKEGELKVVRGGAWCFKKEQAMTFYRGSAKPGSRNNFTGFRVVMPAK